MFGCLVFTINRAPLFLRGVSTKSSLIDLTIDGEGIALMSLKRPPVNSLNIELLQDVNKNLDMVHENECKGLVITSAFPKVFSAGIDLNELCNPVPNNLRRYLWTLHELCLKMYGSSTTTTVAINGYAAAGACLLSAFCDYRVMVEDSKSRIGMNDTAVGIVPRPWICDIFNRVMGYRQAEIALTASAMYTAEEALKVNLIDETALNKEEAIAKCKLFIRKYDSVQLQVKALTKKSLRASVLRYIEDNRDEETDICVQQVLNPHTQKQISMFVQQLKQGTIKY